MSRARKIKKQLKGSANDRRLDKIWDKREERDPFYCVGANLVEAPIKYSRCRWCAGRPHHSPTFFFSTKNVRIRIIGTRVEYR